MKIDTTNHDPAEVFPRALPLEEARRALTEADKYIGYLNGRGGAQGVFDPIIIADYP